MGGKGKEKMEEALINAFLDELQIEEESAWCIVERLHISKGKGALSIKEVNQVIDQSHKMTRPEGSGNSKPTKSDIIGWLKEKGIDCKHDGASIKKSVLEGMAKDAGIDIYAAKNMAMKKRPGSSIDACRMVIQGNTNSQSNNSSTNFMSNFSRNITVVDNGDDEDLSLNQEKSEMVHGINGSNSSDFTMVMHTSWNEELITKGYNIIGRPAPNKAVQTILGCILQGELHQYIISMENIVTNDDHSAIVHMGMSNFLTMVSSFATAGYSINECKSIIDSRYARLPLALFNATQKEAANLTTFVKGLTALERANGVKFTFPTNSGKKIRIRQAAATQVLSTSNTMQNNCLFSVDMLPEEYKAAFTSQLSQTNNDNTSVADMEEDRPPIAMLNLFNCGRFPIMTQREVESHGAQFKHALWKSKNLGVLAPISFEAWKKLASINDEELKEAYSDMDNCIRKVDRIEVTLPIPAKCLGLECSNSKTITIGQKSHQARADERRHDFYIKKMWRTFCPFIKCTCGKTAKENGDCPDTIIWLDHAIWFLMNNLEMAWPNLPTIVKFGFFSSVLSAKPLKTAVIALIGYLKVRDTLIRMTVMYSDNPNSDLNKEFGNTRLSDILEKTIKPIKFLISKQEGTGNDGNIGNRKRASEPDSPDCSIIMPPRLYKRPESSGSRNTHSSSNDIVDIEDNNTRDDSVTKNYAGPSRAYDIPPCNFDM